MDIYIFKDDEYIDEEFFNKLKNGYIIKEMKFELDFEFIPKKYNVFICNIINDKNDDKYTIDIINNSYTYYSNNLTLQCCPFVNDYYDLSELLFSNLKFNLLQLNINKQKNYSYINLHFKKCYITLHKYNMTIGLNISRDDKINNKITIRSNYFKTILEFKQYFMELSCINENVFDKWFDYFFTKDTPCHFIINLIDITDNEKSYIINEKQL